MIKLKTLLYLIPTYQIIQVSFKRKYKPLICETAIKDDLIQLPHITNFIVTSVSSSNDILYINCEERRKTCKGNI